MNVDFLGAHKDALLCLALLGLWRIARAAWELGAIAFAHLRAHLLARLSPPDLPSPPPPPSPDALASENAALRERVALLEDERSKRGYR